MPEDVVIVPHPEFGRLRHEIATATERFQQASEEKNGLLVLFGTLQTITADDRNEFQEQIEAEQEAYEVIKELHDKILRLLREKPQAKAATSDLR
jgi:hypothetical protein